MSFPVTVEWQNAGEPDVVATPAELLRLLGRIEKISDPSRPPLVMVGNEHGVLTIGVGGPASPLSHVPPSLDPPYLVSVGNENADGVIDFFLAGHHTQFLNRNTIPNELAKAVLLEYADTGILSARVTWEHV